MKSGCSLDLFPSRCYLRKRASCVCTFSLSRSSASSFLPSPLSLTLCLYLPSPSPFSFSSVYIYTCVYIHTLSLPPNFSWTRVHCSSPSTLLAHKYKSCIIDSKADVGESCAIGGKPLFMIRHESTKERISVCLVSFPSPKTFIGFRNRSRTCPQFVRTYRSRILIDKIDTQPR